MELSLIHQEKRDRQIIKTTFDWPSFFSIWIMGIPHFLRGQIIIGVVFFVLGVLSIFVDMAAKTEAESLLIIVSFLIFALVISIYFGMVGRKQHVKFLLARGYYFEDENSEVVMHYKQKWNIL